MKYQALMLDFYGTLAREDEEPSKQVLQQVCRASVSGPAAEEVGREWTRHFVGLCDAAYGESFRTQREVGLASVRSLYAHYGVAASDVEAACEIMFERCWRRPTAFEDVAGFLARLRLPVCIVSNVDEDDLRAALRHLGWRFDLIVTSESARSYKPRPEMFRQALALLGVLPEAALHVGDSFSSDVIGARGAGIAAAWLNRRGRPLLPGPAQPTYDVRDLREVEAILQR